MTPAELYRRWLDGVWSGDADEAARVVTADFVGHWPGRDVHGVDGLMAVVRETRGMFDTLAFRLEVGPVVDGDLVAARWAGTGTSSGAVTSFYGHDLLRVSAGRLAEYWPATVTLPG